MGRCVPKLQSSVAKHSLRQLLSFHLTGAQTTSGVVWLLGAASRTLPSVSICLVYFDDRAKTQLALDDARKQALPAHHVHAQCVHTRQRVPTPRAR